MKRIYLLTILLLMGSLNSGLAHDGPAPGGGVMFSLDQMHDHPYRFVPAHGHASQNPGSPKYFVPAYGYRIPGFGAMQRRYDALSPYHLYSFGVRQPLSFSARGYRFETNSTGGPWYHPGWTGNTRRTEFAW